MTRDRKLLALVTDAFGQGGGIAQYNRDFLAAISTQIKDLSIDILSRHASHAATTLPEGIAQVSPIAASIPYAASALRHALRTRPDVIFCGHLYMAPLAAILAKLTGATFILQTHGIDAWTAPKTLQRWAAEQADMILCVSRYTRGQVLSWANIAPERVCVLSNTVSENYSPGDRAAARARFNLTTEYALLSVSRLDPREHYKGIETVLRALPNLAQQRPELLYLVAGEGQDRTRLEALAKDLGVAGCVRFLGFVEQAALPDLFRAADLFVLPSTGEGFGIVFLEAMASGTPALGLAAGGATDALCDGELGTAAPASEFEPALANLIAAPRPDATDLAARVRSRFGREAFQATARALLAPVIGGTS